LAFHPNGSDWRRRYKYRKLCFFRLQRLDKRYHD